ncbi:hypothetical protein dsx2_0991 [Desulfovibrio sp. X2]|uniref:hypothetical protein n=1 Tax=Desulfovibrio sp. X2 TaxID=941449 RepID=UPI000358CD41|nr:hypothetical protein [Desulfovibrio sp. X2]EPR37048.1 hypothetical protein dsx2_0991 [Desulfovibrio sp. X2]
MEVVSLNIPLPCYRQVLGGHGLEAHHVSELQNLVGARPVVMFGDGLTAAYFASLIPNVLCCQTTKTLQVPGSLEYDTIFVGISPSHYADVVDNLALLAGNRELKVILPFERFSPSIACVVETQPRSGTMYVVNSLMRSLGCNYATTHGSEIGTPVFTGYPFEHAGVFFDLNDTSASHVVMTHFFTRARAERRYRDCKYIRVVGYPFDSYFRWAKNLIARSADENYVLRNTSPEWKNLKQHLLANSLWMVEDTQELVVRYEDFHHDFEGTTRRFRDYLQRDGITFKDFRKVDRMYYSDNYREKMDSIVYGTLKDFFMDAIRCHYPEKVASL